MARCQKCNLFVIDGVCGCSEAANSIDRLDLMVRHLISQKDFVTAQANRDTALDGWRMDYAQLQNQLDSEIARLLESSGND